MRSKVQVTAILLAMFLSAGLGAGRAAVGQENPPPPPPNQQEQARGQRGQRGDRAAGTITSVGVDRFEIKRRDGQPFTIFVNDQTRYVRDQQSLALEDLKPGDEVFVRGQTDANQQFTAGMVREITAQDRQRFIRSRAFGRITSIEGNELKISNPREGEQVVVVNDQTRIMKDGQPAGLQDLKVGERVAAFGQHKDGKLVAERIFSGRFRRGPRREGPPQP